MAAFQPEYVNMIGMNANSQALGATGATACVRLAVDPVPKLNPRTMNIRKAPTLSAARMLLTRVPGPTPRRCTHDISQIAETATMVCGDTVSGTYGSGRTK